MVRADSLEQLGFLEHKARTVAQLQGKRSLALQMSGDPSSLLEPWSSHRGNGTNNHELPGALVLPIDWRVVFLL